MASVFSFEFLLQFLKLFSKKIEIITRSFINFHQLVRINVPEIINFWQRNQAKSIRCAKVSLSNNRSLIFFLRGP